MFNKYDFAAVSTLAIGATLSLAVAFAPYSRAGSSELNNPNAIDPNDTEVYRQIVDRVYSDQGIRYKF